MNGLWGGCERIKLLRGVVVNPFDFFDYIIDK